MSNGQILSEQAYAQGKMLDHSGWFGVLPRGITPSDIDMVFDGKRSTLFCELKQIDLLHFTHETLAEGQRRLLFGLVGRGRGNAEVALCSHRVPSTDIINTATDVWVAQVIQYRQRGGLDLNFKPHCLLRDYVEKFYLSN